MSTDHKKNRQNLVVLPGISEYSEGSPEQMIISPKPSSFEIRIDSNVPDMLPEAQININMT
jgi:hypothetical protein